MNQKNIKIGKIYKHKDFEKVRYLGVGRYALNSRQKLIQIDLALVVIEDPDTDSVGTIVAPPEQCFEGFWDDIVPVR